MKRLVLIYTVRTGEKWSECEADDSFPSVKTRKCRYQLINLHRI